MIWFKWPVSKPIFGNSYKLSISDTSEDSDHASKYDPLIERLNK